MKGASTDGVLTLLESLPDLGGRFTNIKRIRADGGAGHFSLILVATDNTTGHEVVVKVFPPFGKDPYRWPSFQREAELLQRLNGTEGIVRLVSPLAEFKMVWNPFGIEVEFPYYVVERAESDVEQLVESARLDTEGAILLFKDMCKAVRRIHNLRIVHRDLKPGNFLVTRDGALRLSDFGTARIVGEAVKPILDDYSGVFPGDIRYTPPEIISSLHDADPSFAFRADMYALGGILFELFTGVNLGTQVFDVKFQQDLLNHMAAVPKENRRAVFDGFISQLADARPLPDITDFGTPMRRSVLPIVDRLYKSLAALDYRTRNSSFEDVFLKLKQALLVLGNEEKIKKWRQQREIYRANLAKKRLNNELKIASSVKGIRQ